VVMFRHMTARLGPVPPTDHRAGLLRPQRPNRGKDAGHGTQ
jgi:hypothetical protein